MKFICFLIVLFNVIAMILSKAIRSKTKATAKSLSKSKSKKGIYYRSPYFGGRYYSGFYRPYGYYYTRPLVLSANLLAPMRSFIECPAHKGKKILVGKSSGSCKTPCNKKSCIQLSLECCIYGFNEKKE